MLARTMFRDTDLKALQNIAELCADRGMHVGWDDTHRLTARGCGSVLASVKPAREEDGVMVTAIRPNGDKRYFDAPSAAFEPNAPEWRKLAHWLEEAS